MQKREPAVWIRSIGVFCRCCHVIRAQGTTGLCAAGLEWQLNRRRWHGGHTHNYCQRTDTNTHACVNAFIANVISAYARTFRIDKY